MQTVLNKQQEGVRDGKARLGDGPVTKNTILHHTTLSVSVTHGGGKGLYPFPLFYILYAKR